MRNNKTTESRKKNPELEKKSSKGIIISRGSGADINRKLTGKKKIK
jgi:hypothetical protein